MAPKKKPHKKGNDDWEADLGETLDPNSNTAVDTKIIEPEQDEDPDRSDLSGGGGGGLLAALKKNKSKKQKKGKVVVEDYVDGEDLSAANGFQDHEGENGIEALAAKVAEDVKLEDIPAKQSTKPKGGKDKQGKATEAPQVDEDGSGEDAGGLKTKKEKEKERKEREKQRKKEQVGLVLFSLKCFRLNTDFHYIRLQRRKPRHLRPRPRQSLRSQQLKRTQNLHPLQKWEKARRRYPAL